MYLEKAVKETLEKMSINELEDKLNKVEATARNEKVWMWGSQNKDDETMHLMNLIEWESIARDIRNIIKKKKSNSILSS